MFALADRETSTASAERFAAKSRVGPLRLVITGAGRFVLYAAPAPEDRDDRLDPHAWVQRIALDSRKTGFIERSRSTAALPALDASESTVRQWPAADSWIDTRSVFSSLRQKTKILQIAERFEETISGLTRRDRESHLDRLRQWSIVRDKILESGKTVRNPEILIPFGVAIHRNDRAYFVCLSLRSAHTLLYAFAPDDNARRVFRSSFISVYKFTRSNLDRFDAECAQPIAWTLALAPIDAQFAEFPFVANRDAAPRDLDDRPSTSPLLADWYANARRKTPFKAVWTAKGALDNDGRLTLDASLGIRLPADYAPTLVCYTRLRPHRGGETPIFDEWIDVLPCPDDVSTPPVIAEIESCCRPDDHFALAQTFRRYPTRREALAFISTPTDGIRYVPASDLPGAPRPPDGVERWFCIPDNENNEATP